MWMIKKNPYLFTLLFNKNDPDHRNVAEILNKKGHDKAKFIAEAIVFYQEYKETGETKTEKIDYLRIERMISEMVEARIKEMPVSENKEDDEYEAHGTKELTRSFSDKAVQGIMQSLDFFRDH